MRSLAHFLQQGICKAGRLVLVAGLMTGGLMLSGCAVDTGPAYGYGGAVGYDYYEPYGVAYGGWDAGYNVGPYRGHGDWHGGGGGAPGPRSFHAAPGGGGPPSLPSGARGGAAGGGGRGGGGGGGRH